MRPEDVGYDLQTAGGNQGTGGNSNKSLSSTQSDTDGDPLVIIFLKILLISIWNFLVSCLFYK